MEGDGIGMIFRSRRVFRKIGCYAGLLFCVSLCFSGLGYGQEGREPALPDGNGKQLTTFVCSQCHGLREIEILRDGQSGWKKTVDRMVLYGAQLSPSEADLVTRYLSTELGPAPPQSAPGNGTKAISLPAGPGKALVATHCAQCHDLERVVSTTRSKADWESITNNMVEQGMQATPDEIQRMVSYLVANFGK